MANVNRVASEILNREDPKVRSQTLGHFINVSWELKKLHNFFCLFAIWAGLNMAVSFSLVASA
jgi:hypothetical protein